MAEETQLNTRCRYVAYQWMCDGCYMAYTRMAGFAR